MSFGFGGLTVTVFLVFLDVRNPAPKLGAKGNSLTSGQSNSFIFSLLSFHFSFSSNASKNMIPLRLHKAFLSVIS
jgi:hypothetical protein